MLYSVFSLPVNSLEVQKHGFKCKRVGINLIRPGVTRGCKGQTVCLFLVRRQWNLRYSFPVGPDDYLAHSYCNCIQTREDRISGKTKIGLYADSGTRREASQSECSNRAKPCDICRDILRRHHHHHISQLGRNLRLVCSVTRHHGSYTVVRRPRKICVRNEGDITLRNRHRFLELNRDVRKCGRIYWSGRANRIYGLFSIHFISEYFVSDHASRVSFLLRIFHIASDARGAGGQTC